MSAVHVFGVRHHGPGSARALEAALDELAPDLVLIEGPKELEPLVPLLAEAGARPPLAGLAYVVDHPARALFYPLASFSPEWVAIQHALGRGVPVGLIDLPATNALAWVDEDEAQERRDPIGELARAAGYDDPERWWEDVLEHRHPGSAIFATVSDAMAALREGEEEPPFTLVREAAMRKRIRAAQRSGSERIAVVCGAWHAPVLEPDGFPTAKSDNELLSGLPKVKVEATWVPWTSDRLAFASGYAAGVSSPAWYHHLFVTPGEDVVGGWMVRAARLLRERGYRSSPADVVEATRLAEALAAVRERPLAGIHELDDAARTALCAGSAVRLAAVAGDLYVGRDMGAVPEAAPAVPLARDLAATTRRLRLSRSGDEKVVELDLRKPIHLERSRLFHRLAILGIHWAAAASGAGRSLGTFKETWVLQWRPELEIAVVEAAAAGATVPVAAAAVLVREAGEADLGRLVGMIEHGMLADLPEAVAAALEALRRRAASLDDLGAMMDAVEPLARITRYGDVRGRDDDATLPVLRGLVIRISVGLAAACASLDDDAALVMYERMAAMGRGVALVADEDMEEHWLGALESVAGMRGAHGLVTGYASRLLLDRDRLGTDGAVQAVSRALSQAADPARGAAWLEGFLTGDAQLLLHDPELLGVLDAWLVEMSPGAFDDQVPLLRRAFSRFATGERRLVGQAVQRLEAGGGPRGARVEIDERRADLVLPTVLALLGPADE